MIPPPITCACGAEIIPGPLWSPALAAAWHASHGSHGAPLERPRTLGGTLPTPEARAFVASLRGSDLYIASATDHGTGVASVLVYERRRGTARAR